MPIEIKSLFSGWKPTTREKAKKYVEFLKNSLPAILAQDKMAYINTRLRGITVEELEEEK